MNTTKSHFPARIGLPSVLAIIKGYLALICVAFPAAQATADTLIHYRVNQTDDPASGVPNLLGSLGNGNLVGSGAGFAGNLPTVGVPPDAGDRSLYFDGSGGITSPGTQQLLNAEIYAAGGFTYEAWFHYLGEGNVNSIIDYAGTEKLDRPVDGDGPRMQTNNSIFDPIADAAEGEWHYVAVVFSNVSSSDNGDTVTGDYTYYFDSNIAQETVTGITISAFGDSLDRTIGVGMHPEGFAGDFFNGLIFEPRVTLGALTPAQLLFQPPSPFLTTEADGKLTITGYDSDGDGNKDCPVGPLVIPATIRGMPVTAIGKKAFSRCDGLTSLTLPDGLKSIGEDAFGGCEGLRSFTLPDGLESIGAFAFNYCIGLTELTLPNSVKNIGGAAFGRCHALTSLTLSAGLKSIGTEAFAGCGSLTSLTLPDGLESIGTAMFQHCRSLTSLTLPAGLKRIDLFAFRYCSALTAVYFLGDAPSVEFNAFLEVADGAKVYYVAGKTGWGATFGNLPTEQWDPPVQTGVDLGLIIHATGPDVAQLEWDSTAGERFEVYHSTDLKTWNSIATVDADNVHTVTVFEGVDTSSGRGFYRVQRVR